MPFVLLNGYAIYEAESPLTFGSTILSVAALSAPQASAAVQPDSKQQCLSHIRPPLPYCLSKYPNPFPESRLPKRVDRGRSQGGTLRYHRPPRRQLTATLPFASTRTACRCPPQWQHRAIGSDIVAHSGVSNKMEAKNPCKSYSIRL